MTENTTETPTREELEAALAQAKEELRTQRRTVVDVSQKYARAHNLCSVVDEALREAGMLTPPETKIIEIEVPMKVTIGYDPELAKDMSEEELKEALSSMGTIGAVTWQMNAEASLGVVTSVANGHRRMNTDQPRTEIGEIKVVSITDPPAAAVTGTAWTREVTLPPGYVLRYTNPEGRKAHLLRGEVLRNNNGRHSNALCGTDGGFHGWRETSPRAEDVNARTGICAQCRRRSTDRLGYRVQVS